MSAGLLAIARAAATAAGAEILRRWDAVHSVATKSSATDPVTEVDKAAESLIRATIAEQRPDDMVIGEEAGRQGGASEIWWVVDPLDGTVNFLYGRDDVAISVAALDVHGPVASCVHAPRLGRTYTAGRGRGAWLDGHPLHLGSTRRQHAGSHRPLERALIGTGFAYDAAGRAAQADMLQRILPRVADLRRSGAAALDVCAVASGALDAFIEDDLAEWDWLGAALVVTEAGGVVTPFTSARGTHGIVAGPHGLVAELLRIASQAAGGAATT